MGLRFDRFEHQLLLSDSDISAAYRCSAALHRAQAQRPEGTKPREYSDNAVAEISIMLGRDEVMNGSKGGFSVHFPIDSPTKNGPLATAPSALAALVSGGALVRCSWDPRLDRAGQQARLRGHQVSRGGGERGNGACTAEGSAQVHAVWNSGEKQLEGTHAVDVAVWDGTVLYCCIGNGWAGQGIDPGIAGRFAQDQYGYSAGSAGEWEMQGGKGDYLGGLAVGYPGAVCGW
jgi:hypothetical protein